MNTIGPGVREIRVRGAAGAFRVMHRELCGRHLRAALFSEFTCCIASEQDAEDQQGGHRPGGEAVPGLGKGARAMSEEGFASVWDALEDTLAAAESLKLRSALMIAL
jgi:hypothetical protein